MTALLLAGYVPAPLPAATGSSDPWGIALVVGSVLALAVAITVALVYFNRPAPKRVEKAAPIEHLRKAA
ncbi:MAG TPA: hypothetical protein VFL29_01505 [Candidatus Dormibacteraeota bacterium]|nr:hypothetical protein [Candidatus Dormibacteraeota bacterium]